MKNFTKNDTALALNMLTPAQLRMLDAMLDSPGNQSKPDGVRSSTVAALAGFAGGEKPIIRYAVINGQPWVDDFRFTGFGRAIKKLYEERKRAMPAAQKPRKKGAR